MSDLTPYDQLGRFPSPFKEIDDFEKRFFGKSLPTFRTDVQETKESYILTAELPGFRPEEIRATVGKNLLTLSAEQDTIRREVSSDGSYIRRERTVGSLCRSFDITGVRAEDITARFENGLLTVTLPKSESAKDTLRELTIETETREGASPE